MVNVANHIFGDVYLPLFSDSVSDFGTQLSFLTLQQCSTMYKEGKAASCGEVGSGNVGVLGCSVNAAAALLDNDSGYSSPKTRPSDSTEQNDTTQNVHLATASIGVSGNVHLP